MANRQNLKCCWLYDEKTRQVRAVIDIFIPPSSGHGENAVKKFTICHTHKSHLILPIQTPGIQTMCFSSKDQDDDELRPVVVSEVPTHQYPSASLTRLFKAYRIDRMDDKDVPGSHLRRRSSLQRHLERAPYATNPNLNNKRYPKRYQHWRAVRGRWELLRVAGTSVPLPVPKLQRESHAVSIWDTPHRAVY